jgi:uncharacterized protein (DUF1501 family)
MTNDDRPQPTHGTGGSDRRSFLQGAAAAAGALALGGALPARAATAARRAGPGTKVTVVLFQRGAADHLNIYAPTGDPHYAQLRPTIGVAPPGSGGGVVGLPLNATFSMHPTMPGLHGAFTAAGSNVGIVHAVGHQLFNRSHFESQDLYETALQTLTTGDGWINRHLQVTAGPQDPPVRALALRGSLPRSLLGGFPSYAVGSMADLRFLGDPDTRLFLEAITAQTPTLGLPAAQRLAYQSGIDAFGLIDFFTGIDPTSYVPANGAAYPAGSLGTGLRQIAEVIKAGLGIEFFAIDQDGWDHHSNLVARLATYTTELDQAVTAFLTDLGALAADVVLVTMSEFGREASENASGGTDHGVGGAMLIAGGAVNGGQVLGGWPGLAPGSLLGGRFLQPVNDYRDVLFEILDQHMGGTDPAVVFPGRTHVPIGVL